jgi:hypothetical protein
MMKYKGKVLTMVRVWPLTNFIHRRGWRDGWEGREVQVVIAFQKVTE